MPDTKNLPAIQLQITELVLAGSADHAEAAINETAEKFGDLAVVEVLSTMEPQVASLHLSSYDGGKLSLATLLIPAKAWAESLAYFAASWDDDKIEDEPEALAESLFAHIHGVIFSSDDVERRAELIHEALSTDWGTTAFAVLFSTATEEFIEIANDIHILGVSRIGHTTSDHDVTPLALEIAHADEEAWGRVVFELFPDWIPSETQLKAWREPGEGDEEDEDDEDRGHEFAISRSTKQLLQRLRKQVPSKSLSTAKKGRRPSLGDDIFS